MINLISQKKTYKYFIDGDDFDKEFKGIKKHIKSLERRGWKLYSEENNIEEKWAKIEFEKILTKEE